VSWHSDAWRSAKSQRVRLRRVAIADLGQRRSFSVGDSVPFVIDPLLFLGALITSYLLQ
jgi:hypothetical protein